MSVSEQAETPWWKGAVVYQIYPRSFFDADGDGTGDLAGITARLDHVRDLGVDAIWVGSFFPSPMADFGYDVSDYCGVDPVFGTMTDLERLLCAAHARGLRVIIDQVYSHTSEQHPWFGASRAREDGKSDWYVWSFAKRDGTPPNNWLSLFGGPAWTWDASRQQYYLHNFLSEQPDLNFHHPEVRQAILDVAGFWLDKGVDGLRLDVANFYFCDARLRDNPPAENPDPARPYHHQRHLYDRSRPENLGFVEELRRLTDTYEGRMTVAEIGSHSYIERSIEYTEGERRLHTAYNFLLLEGGPLTSALIRGALEAWSSPTAWPSWSFSNHDVERARTRWGGDDAPDEFAKMLIVLLACLRGTIFLYQGEELGLPQARVPRDSLKDPEGIRFWPHGLGRDGARTPFPWCRGAPNSGFSEATPWLPVDPRHDALAVDAQECDPDSVLNMARRALAVRRTSAALRLGDIVFEDTPEPILSFRRASCGERVYCMFNLGHEPVQVPGPPGQSSWLLGVPDVALYNSSKLQLAPFGFAVWR
ncbi:MAG: alpha glucosidase [bacterium]|nr:alpha glucosidase [bacterium]